MTTGRWDIEAVRGAFPALAITDDGKPRIYLDAPGGSQVPARVVERMSEVMLRSCANEGGAFHTSRDSDRILVGAHAAAAALLGAQPDEIVFGLNSTSLIFHFSRMVARDWKPGDEIVLTRMDHDGNVGPWIIAAEERGVTVRWLEFDTETFEYRYDMLDQLIGPRTRLVACNHASNIFGTVNDVARIVAAGKAAGAVTMVDAVQSAPHLALDVSAIGCDLLACSAYKFFGPHAGVMYIRPELRDRLTPLKVRPASFDMPWRHTPGTPSFEAQAGTQAAIEHIAWLGEQCAGVDVAAPLRQRIVAGLEAATDYEAGLMDRFLAGVAGIPGFKLCGIASRNRLDARVPTFSFRLAKRSPQEIAAALAGENIFGWAGDFYAYEASGLLGLREQGGVARLGLSHYTTVDEVDQAVLAVARLAA
ncbi:MULTISPECIES: cysteine desulfurase-like protein [unclassified Mesorhizobium]|uniref:cysteine desulfurase-like protein n=1 Tax=unclassified Mesorhizobium TaxID=325217 RepID=UPI0011266B4D|nr:MULTISPECIES: cysteine desulfurase-like protein [unclassified Mesorhizobium]TPI53480.1 cysteine desulfurase-like protein [Mesorhizobium sp. B3-1-1]TPJ68304.1 cysteine desulfurase-like protein [Mesorhizobium sp. B2-6-7]TPJ86846.1 cysteine desulfurase-like protein [Mesorhizobium sp. B2-6-3]TPK02362.1 cysteine desulfurase-like protein [Mesorhizobium sp. B2-5-10]TPK09904.1 cysteine desulfurase-like protein [Mesorhizobium sp. B2-5-11]